MSSGIVSQNSSTAVKFLSSRVELTGTVFPPCHVLTKVVGDYPVTECAERDRSDDRSIDVVLDVLSDRRRRHVLTSLLDAGEEVGLSELAEDIAARDTGPPRSEGSPHASQHRMGGAEDRVQELTASLYHVHIPKLVVAGVVEYDPGRDTVRPTGSARRIERILALTEPIPSG